MKRKYFTFATLLVILLSLFIVLGLITAQNLLDKRIAMLHPKGIIAMKEMEILYIATGLMAIIVLPVFVFIFFFSWKYRASNTKSRYEPNWHQSVLIESIWWAIPVIIATLIGILTWNTTHDLDPYKPITSDKKPLRVQVVALQWKWLFIYPEERIATVNYFAIPDNVPVHFDITADAPMNSFWIPHLGGQIYAMPAMKTELNLIANHKGHFRGCSANISGKGFAGMVFFVDSISTDDFEKWISKARDSGQELDFNSYKELAKPSENNPEAYYKLGDDGLFDKIIMKYLTPEGH